MKKAIEFSRMSKDLLKIINITKDETSDETRRTYYNHISNECFNAFENCIYLMIVAEKLLDFGTNIKRNNDELKNRVHQLEEENRKLYCQLFMISDGIEKKKYKPHVQVDRETICMLKQMGYTNDKIAEQLGISKSTVWRKTVK